MSGGRGGSALNVALGRLAGVLFVKEMPADAGDQGRPWRPAGFHVAGVVERGIAKHPDLRRMVQALVGDGP